MRNWQKEDKTDVAIKIVLFLLNPIICCLYSLHRLKTKSSYLVLYLFALLFGMAFSVTSGRDFNNTLDGTVYRDKFDQYFQFSELAFNAKLQEYLQFDEGNKDFGFDLLAYFITRFTGNYHFLFLMAAAIFAYYALKSLSFLTREKRFNYSFSAWILVFLFMQNDIFNINGMRFWVAVWIAVYCVFQIFVNKNKRYVFLAFLTPIIHGSFWIFLLLIAVSYVLKKKPKLLIVLFFMSFIVSNFSIDFIRSLVVSLPGFIGRMAKSYVDEENIQERAEQTSFLTGFFVVLINVYINLLVYLFIRNFSQITKNIKTGQLFSFLLVLMIFVNFTMPIPSLGGRFMMIVLPLIAYIWLLNFKDIKYQPILYMLPIVFSFDLFVKGTRYLRVLEPDFYVNTPFHLIYKYLIEFN